MKKLLVVLCFLVLGAVAYGHNEIGKMSIVTNTQSE